MGPSSPAGAETVRGHPPGTARREGPIRTDAPAAGPIPRPAGRRAAPLAEPGQGRERRARRRAPAPATGPGRSVRRGARTPAVGDRPRPARHLRRRIMQSRGAAGAWQDARRSLSRRGVGESGDRIRIGEGVAGNLTRDEARERARLLKVHSYQVELDLTEGEERFESITTVTFTCNRPGADTFIDLAGAKVRKVELNGRELDVRAYDAERGRFPLPDLAEHNVLRIDADASYMRTGEGLHRFVDPVDGEIYLHSQFETADAHRMYACFDQPDLKATFELTVLAPSHWEVVSNNPPDSIEELEEHRGRHGTLQAAKRWHFPPTPPISTYITALIAGPYAVVRDEHDGIPLGIYVRRSLAQYLDADNIFQVTKQGFDFFHRVFGLRYPFKKYDQLFVPEFNAGAMENAGAVTFLEDYVFRSRVTDAMVERRAETILHEMAHMWFGDLVTMRWWDDLWLNESFATYM